MGFQTTDTAGEYFAVDAGKVTRLPAVRVRRLVLWGQSKYIKGVMRRSRRTGAPDVESAKRLALQTAFSLKAGGTYEAEEALV